MERFVENERNEFTDETVGNAWNGCCQNCGKKLKWENRGRDNDNNWEAHHKDGNPKNDKQENCQILCWPCHEKTFNKSVSERVYEIFRKTLNKDIIS